MNIGFGFGQLGLLFDSGFSVLPIFVFVFGVCRCPKLQSIIFILTDRRGPGASAGKDEGLRAFKYLGSRISIGRSGIRHSAFSIRYSPWPQPQTLRLPEFKNFTPTHNCLFLLWNAQMQIHCPMSSGLTHSSQSLIKSKRPHLA